MGEGGDGWREKAERRAVRRGVEEEEQEEDEVPKLIFTVLVA